MTSYQRCHLYPFILIFNFLLSSLYLVTQKQNSILLMEGNTTKPKVLIVDDEKGLRIGTKRLLELEGYTVSAAENGQEGIKLGTSEEFDIAIIDLKMPDVDGITVLKEIRKKYPNTVCFIATAYASYDTAIESTKLGAFGYIPKPFAPDELFQHLRRGFERRQLLLENEKWLKEREARLLEVAFEKTRLNTIINSIKDGVLVVNVTGQGVLFNPNALKYLNLNNIVVEEYILDKLPGEVTNLINKHQVQKEYSSVSYNTQLEIKSKGIIVEVTSSSVPHPDGTLAGVVIVIRDITELKKIEMLKSQFISMVSHELKAPLAAVNGFIKLILDKSIPLTGEQIRDFLERSQLRLESLLKMVNDLLDISRIETKTIQREIKELNIKDILKGIIEIFQLDISKKELKVNLEAADNLPSFRGDNDEINRLFTNLVSNAIKYNVNNGCIDIIVVKEDSYLKINIKDTGIGMKAEEKNKLFREFFRAKNEQTKNISGTGLGLSIVKRIVDTYAGKVAVETEFGKGTEFIIHLPVS